MINISDLIIDNCGETLSHEETIQNRNNAGAAAATIIDGLKSMGNLMFHAGFSEWHSTDSLQENMKNIGAFIEMNMTFLERIQEVESNATCQLSIMEEK